MKKMAVVLMALCACVAFAAAANATTIQEGILTYSAGHYLAGQPLKVGYDPYGYNYQAHMFNGSYFNAYSGGAGFPPYEGDDEAYLAENPTAENHWAWQYRDVNITMKWNDAWLSNEDRGDDAGGTVPDGKLDRHYGHGSYIDSGAWETNHQSGSYDVNVDGKVKTAHWTYFVKIVAAPSDANLGDSMWYDADGVEIGPEIWGSFATIQEVYNDPFEGMHGKLYKSPAGPGFGKYSGNPDPKEDNP
jgi:hypothetical protein